MSEEEKREEGAGKMSEAEIDRNLAETFPASDPPSWTLGTDHHDEAPEAEESTTETQRHSLEHS